MQLASQPSLSVVGDWSRPRGAAPRSGRPPLAAHPGDDPERAPDQGNHDGAILMKKTMMPRRGCSGSKRPRSPPTTPTATMATTSVKENRRAGASCCGYSLLCSHAQCYVPAMAAEASLRDRRQAPAVPARPPRRGIIHRYAAEADQWLSGLAERAAGHAPPTWPFWPSAATAGARSAPTGTSMWSWSTTATATSRRWPTPSGTRCGTRASTSTTRCDGRPRCSAPPPRTCGWRSGCSTPA